MKLLNMFFNLLNAAPDATEGLSWHPEKALDTLPNMGKGMLVIFVIIGVIILATLVINKVFTNKK